MVGGKEHWPLHHCHEHMHKHQYSCILLYKDEMLSVPSVGSFFRHARSSVVSQRIDARLARYEAPVLGEHGDFLKMVLSPVVRRMHCFECQSVDDSCRNFTYIPAKPQPRHSDNIYYIFCFTVTNSWWLWWLRVWRRVAKIQVQCSVVSFFLMSNFFVNEKDSLIVSFEGA